MAVTREKVATCDPIWNSVREQAETLVQRDQPLLIDWGAVYKGYCSDLTRTLMIGRVGDRMKTIYKVVLEAQLAAIGFLRPGVTTHQADRVARDIIDKAGFKDFFGHGLGHGIGREIHEGGNRFVGAERAQVDDSALAKGENGVGLADFDEHRNRRGGAQA